MSFAANLSTDRIQPTLPARGATAAASSACHSDKISTHAPRTGSDASSQPEPASSQQFQPTLPARGATRTDAHAPPCESISTHAPRTGSDPTSPAAGPPRHDFNPRSPHGERPAQHPDTPAEGTFQPTLPARGATGRRRTSAAAKDFNPRSPHGERPGSFSLPTGDPISTHAPRTGSDHPAAART